jgi:hypothetical protein
MIMCTGGLSKLAVLKLLVLLAAFIGIIISSSSTEATKYELANCLAAHCYSTPVSFWSPVAQKCNLLSLPSLWQIFTQSKHLQVPGKW